MKLGIIVQARLGSTRLPGKVLMPLAGKTVLGCLMERLLSSKKNAEIIIATTASPKDNLIVDFCLKNDFKFYRGSENDVLSRYYEAATRFQLTDIIRITSDCPLLNIPLLDEMIDEYIKNPSVDYYSNSLKRTYPRGFDIEMFKYEVLKEAYENAREDYQREHVTPYILENRDLRYNIRNKADREDYSGLRLTLDTMEDYQLITAVYARNNNDILSTDYGFIKQLYKNERSLFDLNRHVEQKKIK